MVLLRVAFRPSSNIGGQKNRPVQQRTLIFTKCPGISIVKQEKRSGHRLEPVALDGGADVAAGNSRIEPREGAAVGGTARKGTRGRTPEETRAEMRRMYCKPGIYAGNGAV